MGVIVQCLTKISEKIVEVVLEIFFEKKIIEKTKRTNKKDKMNVFFDKECDKSYQYNETILQNFVPRKCRYYGSKQMVSIKKIKAEIKSRKYLQKNIILTGLAGAGKSTALKWLFLNSNMPDRRCIYLYAKKFNHCGTLAEVLAEIEAEIPENQKCVIFLDGLDELKCIEGNEYEFNKMIRFFDRKNADSCKFVISTRPEHFGFHNMITNRNSETALDNYAIYELDKLSSKEAYRVCRSIEKLYDYDRKNNLKNFINKWPAKEGGEEKEGGLSRKEYIKALKKYITNMEEEHSLLNIPILCRYAYPIICEWNLEGQDLSAHCDETQSDKVKKVLEYYIKWEFHDAYNGQTGNKAGKEALGEYKNRVMDFLTELAGVMGEDDSIDKKQWYKLKAGKIEALNESYCVLQEIEGENENEKLCFVHNTFQDYFLARYYAFMSEAVLAEDEVCDQFLTMLRTNSEFSTMYIEQLLDGNREPAKTICAELLRLENGDRERISEYAKGKRKFIYRPEITFTIEDYLTVFPGGSFLYAGTLFNRHIWNRIVRDGIIELNSLVYIDQYNKCVLTKDPEKAITGVQMDLPDMERLLEHFWIYSKAGFERIMGLHLIPMKKEKDIAELKSQQEHDVLFDNMQKIVDLLGDEGKLWCMYGDRVLSVYKMVPRNEKNISELFKKGYAVNRIVYMTFYGMYRAMTETQTEFLEKSLFMKTDDISFRFNADGNIVADAGNRLWRYYDIHKLVYELLNNKRYSTYAKNRAINLCRDIHFISEKISEPKLKLFYANEQIVLLYILENKEEMQNLAENTLDLCRTYHHTEGIELREYVLKEGISFTGTDLMKISDFEKDYIWM